MSRHKAILGLVDSGVSPAQEKSIEAGRRFIPGDEGSVHHTETIADPLGHGTGVARIILHHAPQLRIYNAQVFDQRGVTSAGSVAQAIDWLVTRGVLMINLSLGLQNDRTILRESCAQAISHGVLLVASSPAQGGAVYPSSYPGVIRATGDARCDIPEISFLDNIQADFGGCPRGLSELRDHKIGGASMGCAHISGQIAGYLLAGGKKASVRGWLVSQAKYVHSERRTV